MEDQLFPDIEFTVKELQDRLGVAQNHSRIRSEMKKFKSLTFEIPEYDKEGNIIKYIYRSWFEEIEYHVKNGKITAKFDNKIKPMLLLIRERITKYDINYVLQMKSAYSIRIYELLKEYQKIGHRTYLVKELMEVLVIPKSLKIYGNFKKRVLLTAQNELKQFSDITFEIDEIKEGRSVVKIKFIIKKNLSKKTNTNVAIDADIIDKVVLKNMKYKEFISYIREEYVFSDIAETNDINTGKSILLSVNEKGLLYNKYNIRTRYNSSQAEVFWKYLYSIKNKITEAEPREQRQKRKSVIPENLDIFDIYENLDNFLPKN